MRLQRVSAPGPAQRREGEARAQGRGGVFRGPGAAVHMQMRGPIQIKGIRKLCISDMDDTFGLVKV